MMLRRSRAANLRSTTGSRPALSPPNGRDSLPSSWSTSKAASSASMAWPRRPLYPSGLPRSIRTGQPSDPMPCLLLGQLATDLSWAGLGIGTGVVKRAVQRCVAASKLLGGRALLANAVDMEAASFWQRRGFLPSRDDPLHPRAVNRGHCGILEMTHFAPPLGTTSTGESRRIRLYCFNIWGKHA